MKQRFLPRTWLWHLLARRKKGGRQKGTTTLAVLSLFFIFSAIGLSLVFLSQISLRIGGLRKNSALLDILAENAVKEGYEGLVHLIDRREFPLFLTDELFAELWEEIRSGNRLGLEEALGAKPPFISGEEKGEQTWMGQTEFRLVALDEREGYFIARYEALITGKGKIASLRREKNATLTASLEMAAGRIPLCFFPFLIEGGSQPDVSFLPIWSGERRNALRPHITRSGTQVLPQNMTPALSQALRVKIFSPEGLTRKQLRQALGLEETDEPIPDGVYLIRDDLGLGGVFVQGDLEELLLAIDGSWQILYFRKEQDSWVLRINPSEEKTVFESPGETETFSLLPVGVVVIRGRVKSLGGGTLEETGRVKLSQEEIPSLLQGFHLALVSSHSITLSSHLIRQGVTWQQGIPYIKGDPGQLIIWAAARDPLTGEEMEGGVRISESIPLDTKIQASILAGGQGLFFDAEGKSVTILGNVQATEVDNPAGRIRLAFDSPSAPPTSPVSLATTSIPLLTVTSLKALEWHEGTK